MRYAIVIEKAKTITLRMYPIFRAVLPPAQRLMRSKRRSVKPSNFILMACVKTGHKSHSLRADSSTLKLRHDAGLQLPEHLRQQPARSVGTSTPASSNRPDHHLRFLAGFPQTPLSPTSSAIPRATTAPLP